MTYAKSHSKLMEIRTSGSLVTPCDRNIDRMSHLDLGPQSNKERAWEMAQGNASSSWDCKLHENGSPLCLFLCWIPRAQHGAGLTVVVQ